MTREEHKNLKNRFELNNVGQRSGVSFPELKELNAGLDRIEEAIDNLLAKREE